SSTFSSFLILVPPPTTSPPFPYTTLFRSHAPAVHFEAARLVKVDRFGPDQRSPVIVDHVFFICIGDSEPRPERVTRPVGRGTHRSEEHTSELKSRFDLVCRLLLEKKK